jgi:hypothetical protein
MRRVSHSPATRSVICRRRSRLAALAMLGLVAVSFAVNGRAPGGVELWLILGDGVNQAADLASGATSIPSWNLTPWMTFGNWF